MRASLRASSLKLIRMPLSLLMLKLLSQLVPKLVYLVPANQ
jgi:hypothetical protein